MMAPRVAWLGFVDAEALVKIATSLVPVYQPGLCRQVQNHRVSLYCAVCYVEL